MIARYAALAGRLRESLADLVQIVERAERLADKAERLHDDDYLDGVALNLHSFYAGVERLLEDVARTLDDALPTGPEWHQDLLRQMSAEVASIRPAVLRQSTRRCLDEYRGFRHIVRHTYTFTLRPARLKELALGLRACYQDVREDGEAFALFLEQLATDPPAR